MNTFTMNTPSAVMNIFSLLATLVNIYSYAILARVLLSWLPNLGSLNTMYDQYGRPIPQKRPIYDFLCRITDPYMNLFRSKQLTLGRIDYSPLIALMILNILKSVFQIIASSGRISIFLILAIIVQNLWSYLFSYLFFIMLIMLAVRWFLGRNPNDQRYRMIVDQLDRILNKPVSIIFKLFYKRRTVSDEHLVLVSLIIYGVLYFAIKYGCNALVSYLIRNC